MIQIYYDILIYCEKLDFLKKIISTLICFFLLSCSKENLYEFHDLSGYRDFVYRIEFYPINKEEPIEFSVKEIKTNGYNELKTKTNGFSGKTERFVTFETAVKRYRLTGVYIFPENNIGRIEIFLYEIGIGETYFSFLENSILYQQIENPEPVSMRYDFETGQASFNLIGED